jgi:hypothetical protein
MRSGTCRTCPGPSPRSGPEDPMGQACDEGARGPVLCGPTQGLRDISRCPGLVCARTFRTRDRGIIQSGRVVEHAGVGHQSGTCRRAAWPPDSQASSPALWTSIDVALPIRGEAGIAIESTGWAHRLPPSVGHRPSAGRISRATGTGARSGCFHPGRTGRGATRDGAFRRPGSARPAGWPAPGFPPLPSLRDPGASPSALRDPASTLRSLSTRPSPPCSPGASHFCVGSAGPTRGTPFDALDALPRIQTPPPRLGGTARGG